MKRDMGKTIKRCEEFSFLTGEFNYLMRKKPWLYIENDSVAKKASQKRKKEK